MVDDGLIQQVSGDAPLREQLGRHLWSCLAEACGGDLEQVLAEPERCRVVLNLESETLRSLPWELLFDGRRYLFQDLERPWSRGAWLGAQPETPLAPLRLLVVVCAPEDGLLQADEELDGIHRAVGRAHGLIHMEIVDAPAGWQELRRDIESRHPHVIHFIGHAVTTRSGAELEFTSAGGAKWQLDDVAIRNRFPLGARLVVLNACGSERASSEGVKVLADALRARGVTAVVSMRGEIRSDAAVCFGSAFYASLASGDPIDVSTSAGRGAIFDELQALPDWSFPMLQSDAPPERVLPLRLGIGPADVARIATIAEFASLDAFVDRSEQRRKTWWALDTEDLPVGVGPGRHAVLITGPKEHGKTSLAVACLLTGYLRGRQLQYIDLAARSPEDGSTTKDWLAVLRAVRDGVDGCQLSQSMPVSAFGGFTARLNWLLERPAHVDMPTLDTRDQPDHGDSFDPNAGQALQRIGQIFLDFLGALRLTANTAPLMLALDHVEEVLEVDWKDHLLPRLVRPIARGDVPNVRLLLVVPDEKAELVPEQDVRVMEHVRADKFPTQQLDRLAREYGERSDWPDKAKQRCRTFFNDQTVPVPPSLFPAFADLLKLSGVLP